MKTTTVYRQTLTITTDDDGSRTITRTSSADTDTAYLFDELSKEAQDRAISDAIEEETNPENWWSSQTYFAESEIIDAAEELEKHQPIEIAQDQGCSWYGTASGAHWWKHPANWESVTEEQNTGICYSMDICDAWNEYAARIIALQDGHEDAEERAYIHDENADNAAENGDIQTAEAERRRAAFYEDMAERIEAAAEELTEEAARAVGNVVDSLIESERDYYSSPEFWNEWLNDGETRFTREGERI